MNNNILSNEEIKYIYDVIRGHRDIIESYNRQLTLQNGLHEKIQCYTLLGLKEPEQVTLNKTVIEENNKRLTKINNIINKYRSQYNLE